MTKAEIKKMETAKKHDFIMRVYEAVLVSIPALTRDSRTKVQIRMTHANYNRYVRFHIYGQDMAILIYGDGNVAIELKEVFHSAHTEQLFEYDTEIEKQETFIEKFKELLSCLIKVFMGMDILDFHSYMDYVSVEKNASVAYQKMQMEYGGYSEQ